MDLSGWITVFRQTNRFLCGPVGECGKPEIFCTWEYNCQVTWIDKQRRLCDLIHLTLYSVLSRQWPRLSRRAVWMSVSASRCVRLKEPLRCSPLGLPDIISHYPRHSSNTAGARKHGSLVGARLPHVYVLFSAALSLALPRGAFPNVTPGRPGEMQICTFWRSMLM